MLAPYQETVALCNPRQHRKNRIDDATSYRDPFGVVGRDSRDLWRAPQAEGTGVNRDVTVKR